MNNLLVDNIQRLSADDCHRYRKQLQSFYHSNVLNCSYMSSFTYDDCGIKIDSLISHVADDTAVVYGYIVNGELEGYIWAYEHPFRDERRMYVSELFVDQTYRGGIGKSLLKAVEREALARGLPSLYIHAEAENTGAIRLYQREGYEPERVQLRKPIT